jgi:hypothetical protein
VSEPHAPPPLLPASDAVGTRAVVVLVLGTLGVACLPLCSPFAWYLGNQELRAIHAGAAPAAGEGWATAGKILGVVGTLLLAALAVSVAVWIFFFGGLLFLQGLTAGS